MAPLGSESRDDFLSFELAAAARKLVTEVRPIRPGDQVLITLDTAGDSRTARATAAAVLEVGGVPTLVTYPTAPEPMREPPRPVALAATGADVWFDFAVAYQLYSPAFDAAVKAGCIYVCLTAMDVDMMVRTIGRVPHGPLEEMAHLLYRMSQAATTIRLTNPAGTDLRMTVDPAGDPYFDQERVKGFAQMLGGQSWPQVFRESFEGVLVYDGCVWPPASLGILRNPVRLSIEAGVVVKIDGGPEAAVYDRWLRGFGHPAALRMDHACYGFNPGVTRPSGRILEDERVFGCMQFGVGVASAGSPIHSDGVTLNPSVWFDDVQVEDEGRYTHPDLVRLCRAMGVEGY